MSEFKARALYHLLHIRAKKIVEGAGPEVSGAILDIQPSLAVAFANGGYTLGWSFRGKDCELNVPYQRFSFYVRGDEAKALTLRPPDVRLREQNWKDAGDLWRDLLHASGVLLPNDASFDKDGMGLTPPAAGQDARIPLWASIVVSALVAGLLAFIVRGQAAGLWTGAAAAALGAWATQLRYTHLRAPLMRTEVVVICAGAALAGCLAAPPILALVAAIGALLWAVGEGRPQAQRRLIWLASGVVFGGMAALLGPVDIWFALLMIVAMLLASVFMPDRAPLKDSALFSLAIAAGTWVGLQYPVQLAGDAPSTAAVVGLAAAAGILLAGAFWWVHGVMSRITPWFGLLSFGFLAVFTPAPLRPQLLALSGLCVVVAIRVMGFRARSSTIPARRPRQVAQ